MENAPSAVVVKAITFISRLVELIGCVSSRLHLHFYDTEMYAVYFFILPDAKCNSVATGQKGAALVLTAVKIQP